MTYKICYIADLDQDIDDIIAFHYLLHSGYVDEVACSPYPETDIGKARLEEIVACGVDVVEEISLDTDTVFCGGALTPVASFMEHGGRLGLLVVNGGYVGEGLAQDPLPKFSGRRFARTYNFNCDVEATDKVLRSLSSQIEEIVCVGKNVCHSPLNTISGIWSGTAVEGIARGYGADGKKRLHDVLACREGICWLEGDRNGLLCSYAEVRPVTEGGLDGNLTRWGSIDAGVGSSPYRCVSAACGWRNE